MPAKNVPYTFYFPTAADKARWKRLSKPYPMNQWIFMTVESAIANESPPDEPQQTTEDADVINHLRTQNDLLTARLQSALSELETLRTGAQTTLDTNVADILKSGGVWTSENLLKKLALSVFTANVENIIGNKDINNTILDIKRVEKTLETLQDLHIIENTWQGFKWIK